MVNAKVSITGLDAVKASMTKFLTTALNDKILLTDVAELTKDQIVKRTQGRQEEYKQKNLKPVTIEARKILMDINGHSGFAKPTISNLTLTGQLLESVSYKILQASAKIVFYLKDYRYDLLPLSQAEKKVRYNQIIDQDHNATNKSRKDSKDKARINALFIAAKKPKHKTNTEIKKDLEQRGFRFFFLSENLQALLKNRIKQEFRRKLSNYKKLSKLLR